MVNGARRHSAIFTDYPRIAVHAHIARNSNSGPIAGSNELRSAPARHASHAITYPLKMTRNADTSARTSETMNDNIAPLGMVLLPSR
jgi:hypothetical protein